MSAEYVLAGGNPNVILCERGIRTFEKMIRNNLDISAVPLIKQKSHLPVIIDPSHAAGIAWMVQPLARTAIAAGADGLMLEGHNDALRLKRKRCCKEIQSRMFACPQNVEAKHPAFCMFSGISFLENGYGDVCRRSARQNSAVPTLSGQ